MLRNDAQVQKGPGQPLRSRDYQGLSGNYRKGLEDLFKIRMLLRLLFGSVRGELCQSWAVPSLFERPEAEGERIPELGQLDTLSRRLVPRFLEDTIWYEAEFGNVKKNSGPISTSWKDSSVSSPTNLTWPSNTSPSPKASIKRAPRYSSLAAALLLTL